VEPADAGLPPDNSSIPHGSVPEQSASSLLHPQQRDYIRSQHKGEIL